MVVNEEKSLVNYLYNSPSSFFFSFYVFYEKELKKVLKYQNKERNDLLNLSSYLLIKEIYRNGFNFLIIL